MKILANFSQINSLNELINPNKIKSIRITIVNNEIFPINFDKFINLEELIIKNSNIDTNLYDDDYIGENILNQPINFNFTKLVKLKKLTIIGIAIKTINLNLMLEKLELKYNKLKDIDLENNKLLNYLNIQGNKIFSINLNSNINLKNLILIFNKFHYLNISKLINLEKLILLFNEENRNEIDLSNNINLKTLILDANNINDVDISNLTNLEKFTFSEDQLIVNNYDFSNNNKLKKLTIAGNGNLKEINISKLNNLEVLDLHFNSIIKIDLKNNLKIKKLILDGNNLTELNISKLKDLKILGASNNHLKLIDISNNTKLVGLFCQNNPFIRKLYIKKRINLLCEIYKGEVFNFNKINIGKMNFKNNKNNLKEFSFYIDQNDYLNQIFSTYKSN